MHSATEKGDEWGQGSSAVVAAAAELAGGIGGGVRGIQQHAREQEQNSTSPSEDFPPFSEDTVEHGEPVDIQRCFFQGHAARLRDQREVGRFVKASRKRAHADSGRASSRIRNGHGSDVCALPFAYRLERRDDRGDEGGGAERELHRAGAAERGVEGYGDGGDIGMGEKLLQLLRRWDVQNMALAVSRVDGGFMMAELLGVKRYKVVMDRAHKVLEACYLDRVRRAMTANVGRLAGVQSMATNPLAARPEIDGDETDTNNVSSKRLRYNKHGCGRGGGRGQQHKVGLPVPNILLSSGTSFLGSGPKAVQKRGRVNHFMAGVDKGGGKEVTFNDL